MKKYTLLQNSKSEQKSLVKTNSNMGNATKEWNRRAAVRLTPAEKKEKKKAIKNRIITQNMKEYNL